MRQQRTNAAASRRCTAGSAGLPPAPVPTGPLPPRAIPPVNTEGDGKFVVPDLGEGAYRVSVTMDGYVPQAYGQRVFPGGGTPLKLAAGEVLKDITFRLTPTAAINGRVTDNEGKPAAGVQLQMVRVTYNAAGQKTLQNPTRATTNDRGEYRLYWIIPGRYYLAAGTPPGNTAPIQPDWYPFIYYPNTMDINRAQLIDVKSGSEATFDIVIPANTRTAYEGVSAMRRRVHHRRSAYPWLMRHSPVESHISITFKPMTQPRDFLKSLISLLATTSFK